MKENRVFMFENQSLIWLDEHIVYVYLVGGRSSLQGEEKQTSFARFALTTRLATHFLNNAARYRKSQPIS